MSLLLLSLPWAGCQYLQAVDLVLRDIQAKSLKTNAESIASRLVTKPELFNQPHINVAKNVLPLYTTLLNNAPIIDGYEDDWRSYNAVKKNISNGKLSASIQVGEYRERVYFFISVNDDTLNYYNPAQAGDFSADHLVLTRYKQSAVDKEVYIYSSAPGALAAHYKNQDGRLTAMSAIKGIWREHAGGYQLELEIDKAFLATGFNLDIIDFRNGEENRLFLNDLLAEQAVYDYMEIVSLSVMVQEELASIGLDDISVYILNHCCPVNFQNNLA